MLLRFPNEVADFRDVRRDARAQFAWRCRVPVLRQFGAEAADLGIFVTACAACGGRTARLHPFADLDPDLSLDGLLAELRTRAGRVEYGWRPAACPACDARRPQPIAGVFARYLPEIGRDLHIELICGNGRVVRSRVYLVDAQGDTREVAGLGGAATESVSETAVVEALGAPVSLRALWRAMVAENVYADAAVTRAVQPGYVIGVRPFCDDPVAAEAMLEPVGALIEGLQAEGGAWDVLCFLHERELHDIPVPFQESYHAWLGGYALEIGQGLVMPFMLADSGVFLAVLAEQAARHGLSVTRDSGEGTLFGRFRGGALDLRVALGPLFFRVLHGGETFHRGIARHFTRELRAMRAAAALPGEVRALLPGHAVQVRAGRYLEVLDRAGARVAFGDMVRLATHYDLTTEQGRAGLLGELGGAPAGGGGHAFGGTQHTASSSAAVASAMASAE